VSELEFKIKPYFLKNKIQHYAWGAKNEQAFIPRLLGLDVEKDKPYAELWMGTHPKAPSVVIGADESVSLDKMIEFYPRQILGDRVSGLFNNKLPFLFKILSAGEALSIQAHPNLEQAAKLHRRDPKNYPDDNHKPEIAIALDYLTALIGFRSYEEIIFALKKYPEIARFIGKDICDEFFGCLTASPAERKKSLKKLFTELLARSADDINILKETLRDLEKRIADQPQISDEREQLFLELRRQYGDDVGLFSLFLLDLVHLQSGQGAFLDAGIPHAYLKGNIVECMANSDNVVRAGLTSKFKDCQTLADILTFESGPVNILGPDDNKEIFTYPSSSSEFELTRISLQEGSSLKQSCNSVQIMIIIEGLGKIIWGAEQIDLRAGDSILIPAALTNYSIISKTDLLVFRAGVPVG
jgi:mannose-6-phosphate isomerase